MVFNGGFVSLHAQLQVQVKDAITRMPLSFSTTEVPEQL
jgi:hypothetical protein